jgi:Uma2 family endonuclease
MSVAAYETELLDHPHAQLQAIWEELDAPLGCRAEILEGTIVVAPPPANIHNTVAAALNRLLVRSIPDHWDVHQTQALQIGSTGDIYIPDLLVFPREDIPDSGTTAPAEHALLVVEITSPSNADHDRKQKLWGYAHGPVPLYLLVDRHAKDGPHVTLYSRPESGEYQNTGRVPYGETITLPEPFDLKIDTGLFLRT